MTQEKRPLILEDLYTTKLIEDPRLSPDGKWVAFVRVDIDKDSNSYKRNLWLAATDGRALMQITRSGKDSSPRWSPNGSEVAFISGRGDKPQIYLLSVHAPGGEPRPLTSHINGVTAFNWSPDGAQMAFLAAMNAEERTNELIPDAEKPKSKSADDEAKRNDPRIIRNIPYRVGTSYVTDRFAQIYVMEMAEGQADDAPPRRLTDVDANYAEPQWSADSNYLYTSRPDDPTADEPGRRTVLFIIRVSDGAHQQFMDATHAAGAPLASPDGRWLAFGRMPHDGMSLRINRLAVMPTDTLDASRARDLTLAADLQPTVYRWQGINKLVFSALKQGAGGVFSVDLEGVVTPLVEGPFKADAFDVMTDGSAIAFVASQADTLQELYVTTRNSGGYKQLTHFNAPVFETVDAQPMHHLVFLSPSGLELDGWYVLPVGYEPGAQYPLILDIHGGPHVMWGPHDETVWLQWQYFAANGYIVFFCNPRGSGGYGEMFQQAIHRGWAQYAYEDIMAGLDALIAEGFVDTSRMGVTGGSYGGYMTTWMVAHTDRFKAAVTQRGVYNLLSFFGTTDIPSFVLNEFGTTPLEDPEYLWAQSPLAHAHKIKTPLLIMHSENDYRVPISEAEQLYGYVKRIGLKTEFVRYPREGHELSRAGEPAHRIDRLSRMVAWFDLYLKQES